MSLTHRNHVEYAAAVAPRLQKFIDGQRDRKFELALGGAFSLYSFITEDFRAKATANLEIYDCIGVMMVEVQDAFRGILHGQASLSPVTLAALTRVALEVRFNLEFIVSRDDPAVWADRYKRYGQVSTLAHDVGKPSDQRRLSEEEVARIRRACGEWVRERPEGGLKFNFNWTADSRFDSLKKIAAAVGLTPDYESTYSVTSNYVHGTYLLINAYHGPQGIGPVGGVGKCKQMAFLGANHCLSTMKAACAFFGVPLDDLVYALAREAMREACRDLLDGAAK